MKKHTDLLFSDIRILQKLFTEDMSMPAISDTQDRIDYDVLYVNKFHKFQESNMLITTETKKHKTTKDFDHFDIIIDFGAQDDFGTAFKSKNFHYINNPDQSMRWVYPEEIASPSFLNFYNTASLKAKLIAQGIKSAFALGMRKRVSSGQFTIHYKEQLAIDVLLKDLVYDHYSIFTGTNGLNRTVLAEVNRKGESTHFLKMGLSIQASGLIVNEHKNLQTLNELSFDHFSIPESQLIDDSKQLISNIRTEDSRRSNELEEIHAKALEELYDKTPGKQALPFGQLKERYDYLIANIRSPHKIKQSNRIVKNLQKIVASIPDNTMIPVARAHYDFTPWNMFVSNGELRIYDWELSIENMPVLFDAYHFIFQKSILTEHKSIGEITEELEEVFQRKYMQHLIEKYQIDTDLQLKLYLIEIAAYYTALYQRNKTNSPQEIWQMNCWSELSQLMVNQIDIKERMSTELIYASNFQGKSMRENRHQNIKQRHHFIGFFCSRLIHFPHTFLKLGDEHPMEVSKNSDLDILVQKKDIKQLVNYVRNHEHVKDYKAYYKSFMASLEITFDDDSFLSLDLIHDFRRKGLVYLDAKTVLDHSITNVKNISVPAVHHDFEYCFLFYMLNKASLPEKYIRYFKMNNAAQKNYISSYITKKYHLKYLSFEELCSYSVKKLTAIKSQLKYLKNNRFQSRLYHAFYYIKDTVVELVQRKGFVITFSGVDGAGKSTIIEAVREQLSGVYRKKVIVLRHRPGILPIISAWKYGKEAAEKRTVERLPRTGNNKSKLSSFLRFMYYYTDYIIGQLYIYFRYILRGYIVLYDRYYFDFINDGKRSNIQLNKTFVKQLYSLIYKPRFNYFLYASPEVILQRKKELKESDIIALTQHYKELFEDYNKRYHKDLYLGIENINKEQTIATIMKSYLGA